jgi:flagellar biosynthesis component FlhA
MQCVLNTAQALEAFFYLAIKKKLLFDPRINQVIGNSEFNELSKKLYENIENNTCPDLYKIFKRLYYETINLDTKEKIIDVIKNIKKLGKDFDETITHVWKLRCRVGRKEAYRPTKEEAEKCIAFARKAIMKFAIDFKISTPIQFWPQGSLK